MVFFFFLSPQLPAFLTGNETQTPSETGSGFYKAPLPPTAFVREQQLLQLCPSTQVNLCISTFLMAASPESFGPSSSSSLPLLHLDGFRLLFLARPQLRQPQAQRSDNPLPMDPSQLPRAGCCGQGVTAPPPITVLSGRLPRKIDGGSRVPGGFASLSAGLRGRVCVCGEEPGAEGGLGTEATSFTAGGGFFLDLFF